MVMVAAAGLMMMGDEGKERNRRERANMASGVERRQVGGLGKESKERAKREQRESKERAKRERRAPR
jgi:hypothetical protein